MVQPLYWLMGMCAAVGNRTSGGIYLMRTSGVRLHLMPSNWIILLILVSASFSHYDSCYRSLTLETEPISLDIAQAQALEQGRDAYVTLHGVASPATTYVEKGTKFKGIQLPPKTYYAVLDRDGRQGLFVEADAPDALGEAGATVALTGILTATSPSMHKELARANSLELGPDYAPLVLLKLGEAPGDALDAALLALMFGAAAFAWLLAWLKRHLVFEPIGPWPAESALATGTATSDVGGGHARGSGVFYLQKDARRFTWLECSLGESLGKAVATANVDASTIFLSYRILKRMNTVTRPLVRGNGAFVETGWQYYGFSRYPALRVRRSGGRASGADAAVFAFDRTAERDKAAAWLTRETAQQDAEQSQPMPVGRMGTMVRGLGRRVGRWWSRRSSRR